jgi:hypothetical protein
VTKLPSFEKQSTDFSLRVGEKPETKSAYTVLENLLNLLFDTIEFSNNNLKRFFPGFSSSKRVCENAVSFIAIDALKRSQIRYLGSSISISDLPVLQ